MKANLQMTKNVTKLTKTKTIKSPFKILVKHIKTESKTINLQHFDLEINKTAFPSL